MKKTMIGKSNKVQTIILSCNRAMQLQLLLTSIRQNINGIGNILVTYNHTDGKFLEGYQKLMKEGLANEWVSQQDYINTIGYTDYIVRLIKSKYPYTCFLCDDSVIFGKASINEIISCITEDVIAFALRLGLNTKFVYVGNESISKPSFYNPLGEYEDLGKFIKWNWKKQKGGHYHYPISQDGCVYRTNEIINLLQKAGGKTPNQIEHNLYVKQENIIRSKMVAYKHSVLISIPINRVQSDFDTHFAQKFNYSTDELNEAYLNNKIIDFDKMDFKNIKGSHQELALPLKDL